MILIEQRFTILKKTRLIDMHFSNRTLKSGRLIHARPSPNFNDRPAGVSIDCIVIHYTDYLVFEEFMACHLDHASQLSAHYLINDDGTIYQLVADEKRAWHAGISHWNGRDNINHNSIGIELQNGGMTYKEQFGNWPDYTDIQMQALAELIHDLQMRFLIPTEHIVGHNDIAPDRKIDPGPHFKWGELRARLKRMQSST